MKDTLLTEKDIKTLESYSEGYFYKMLHYIRDFIDTGLKEKRFTQKRRNTICRLHYGFLTPATILTNMNITIRLYAGSLM